MTLNLKKLGKKLDQALDKETAETLTGWLKSKRKKKKPTHDNRRAKKRKQPILSK